MTIPKGSDYNPRMLTNLHVSNIVLIDKLNLEFGPGLNVLTGETGAGKSILLDALALALGARSDTDLIRAGCDSAQVIAEFNSPLGRGAPKGGGVGSLFSILSENGIEPSTNLILRRMLTSDGKSRAFVNDIPVSVKTLKQIGDELCEIHGQFENHSLLDSTTHLTALDEFAGSRVPPLLGGAGERSETGGGYNELLNKIRYSYNELHSSEKKLNELQNLFERSAQERDFLEFNVAELAKLNPLAGEEEELSSHRTALMDAEKNSAILAEASAALHGLDEKLFAVAHILERIKTNPNPYQTQIDSLYEIGATASDMESKIAPQATDTQSLEEIEERLFAIRAAARKHKCTADELAQKFSQMQQQLAAINNSDSELKELQSEVKNKKAEFDKLAQELTLKRKIAAKNLRKEILKELPDLKLAQADFDVEIKPSIAASATGADNVIFLITTNPGTPFAPLHKIASGGELARLMLALRVVLMDDAANKTFIFDEVDTGISGATAAAVGARLGRLAAHGQALVITHSAQVAGCADNHYLIQKSSDKNSTTATVSKITEDARLSEIARIISGKKITKESLATAKTLIKHQ